MPIVLESCIIVSFNCVTLDVSLLICKIEEHLDLLTFSPLVRHCTGYLIKQLFNLHRFTIISNSDIIRFYHCVSFKKQAMINAFTETWTIIHGKRYDLSEFKHPGGTRALSMAYGRDATVLFESHHPFTSRKLLDYHLNKLESSLPLPLLFQEPFDWKSSSFRTDLVSRVKSYFEKESIRRNVSLLVAIKATPARWASFLVLSLMYLFSLKNLVAGNIYFIMIFPISAWLFAANVFHDASHFSISTNQWINDIAVYLFPFATSPFTWAHQHIIGHQYFNFNIAFIQIFTITIQTCCTAAKTIVTIVFFPGLNVMSINTPQSNY